MQNDVLKNEIAPWQEKGRWYKLHILNGHVDPTNTDTDVIASDSNQFVSIANKKCIDCKLVVNSIDTDLFTTRQTLSLSNRLLNDGRIGITLGITPGQLPGIDCNIYIYAK